MYSTLSSLQEGSIKMRKMQIKKEDLPSYSIFSTAFCEGLRQTPSDVQYHLVHISLPVDLFKEF